MLKRILKIVGGILLGLFLLLFIAGLFFHQSLPKGETGPEAEALAQKMLQAINKEAWDSTGAVSWSFMGINHYLWDRERHWVEVKWEDKRVLLRIDEKTGLAWIGEASVENQEEKEKMLNAGWKKWVNDSFWMNAPAKALDPGTSRLLVTDKSGRAGLLVSYSQGGATPGDSYLWWLDEAGLPESWQMWVGIIPIGGIRVSWEDWKTLKTGAKVSELHLMGGITLQISDVQGAHSVEALTGGTDPFSAL
ncbi:MAG: hypothetical protein AAGA10_05150 [Bacteroidota bacterium]